MKADDQISKVWCGMILGAGLAAFVASLCSGKPESRRPLDEAWLASLRAQGW